MKQYSPTQFLADLNSPRREKRLSEARRLAALCAAGRVKLEPESTHVNNHIHTTYSFSPYSPTAAVWMARANGLRTAGIMDHDTVAGGKEFIEAGKIFGVHTTVGVECRVSMDATPLRGRRINNPDQTSNVYMAVHGIPHTMIETVTSFLAPFREFRNTRNRAMIDRINELLPAGIAPLDFERDVLPLSQRRDGGAVTERHLMFALAHRLIESLGQGHACLTFCRNQLQMEFTGKQGTLLESTDNPFYAYDLLGALKSSFIPRVYINADRECPPVQEVVDLARRCGAIAAYAYLGDITESVTGDKRAQQFEDGFLDELFEVISRTGFHAVTYMPMRNTAAQLLRVKGLCRNYGLMEISGEDINSPRQAFVNDTLQQEEFKNLVDSTYALIASEKRATIDIRDSIMGSRACSRTPDINRRILEYRDWQLSS